MKKIGVLITNTGTPDAQTTRAVRRYLREFLSDKRVVQIPRIIWLPILYGLILPFRSRKSAKLYQTIWTKDGSPMRTIMQNLRDKLWQHFGADIVIELGMNYGNPSIPDALTKFRAEHVNEIIVLPLYPQYSNTTTAATFDRVIANILKWPALPGLKMLRDFHDDPAYIQALANSIQHYWDKNGMSDHLLISFHGIPKRFVAQGDTYEKECEKTAKLLANALRLPINCTTLCYQSQFGYDKWLTPSTQVLLTKLPKRGIKKIDIVCPGFSIDCLETLEEIAITGKESFLHAGGESYRYIPALNDSDQHIDFLIKLILPMKS